MSKEKKSFFEKLTGTVRLDEDNEIEDRVLSPMKDMKEMKEKSRDIETDFEEERDGQLTVDVYQTNDAIILKTMVAGVRPDDLDISITRDMVTIRGKREEERSIGTDNYFVRELYWGSFSRSISLPEEIDVEDAEAVEKHGLLIIKLPKLDKKKQAKVKVRTI